MEAPKLFISYSWSNAEHDARVLNLATELTQSGVNVILDKWDLKEGHDATAFMEKMVTDETIKKVLIICDEVYCVKANKRTGGVGTETQIITAEIYSKQDQTKFVAVIYEKDQNGNPFLPVYYKARIYIDLSEFETYSANFEKLLRWVYDKPLHVKPALGSPPAFLSEPSEEPKLRTHYSFKKAIEAIRTNRANSRPAIIGYFELFTNELENFIVDKNSDPFDEAIVKSLSDFLPYRNEIIEMITAIALHQQGGEYNSIIHQFFERFLSFFEIIKPNESYKVSDFDNFKFLGYELFLYTISLFLKYEQFGTVAYLLTHEYFIPERAKFGRSDQVSYLYFNQHLFSLEQRNQRLNLRRISLKADFIENRTTGTGVSFRQLMQADFLLFFRDHVGRPEVQWHWSPDTLNDANELGGKIELFARCKSKAYFEQVKEILGIEKKEDLLFLFDKMDSDLGKIGGFFRRSYSIKTLIGYDEMCTKP